MIETRQSALQRIQVGLIGLVVVLLFVSLANMVLDRATNAPSVSAAPGMPLDSNLGTGADVPTEPLAELGVTPVAKDEEPSVAPAGSNNVRRVPAQRPR